MAFGVLDGSPLQQSIQQGRSETTVFRVYVGAVITDVTLQGDSMRNPLKSGA